MKALNLMKVNLVLVLIFTLGISYSCQDGSSSNNKGTYDGENSCELIDADEIRSIFKLSNSVEIEQSKNLDEICYYRWHSESEELDYSIRFAFSRWDKKSLSEVEETWEMQNKNIYNKHNLQEISGIGDKASWSEYEKGQLRVAAKGYFFYLSLYVSPKEESNMSTEDLIEKTSAIAKQIVKNM